MALSQSQYQAYSRATHTVGKLRQVVMLYEGAIRFLKMARLAIEEKRVEDRYNHLVRVSEIVIGLQSCLDFETGGDVARILFDFYSSVDWRVMSIHRSNSAEMCDQLVKELTQMRDAWDKIDRESTGGGGSDSAASSSAGEQPPATDGHSGVYVSA